MICCVDVRCSCQRCHEQEGARGNERREETGKENNAAQYNCRLGREEQRKGPKNGESHVYAWTTETRAGENGVTFCCGGPGRLA